MSTANVHDIAGFLVLYSGGAYRHFLGPFAVEKIAGWPDDGLQIAVVFFVGEWAPGKNYRQYMMGNDRYFFVPSTGVVGHSDESAGQIRQRYGSDAQVIRGRWTTADEFHRLNDVAKDCDSVSKLTDEWLSARIAEALA